MRSGRQLGESRFKEMFMSLNAAAMKQQSMLEGAAGCPDSCAGEHPQAQ